MWKAFLDWCRERGWWRPQALGDRGEQLAAQYLKRLGYTIVARQVRTLLGELDIIAVDETEPPARVVVFVEVRTKTSAEQGDPAETVDYEKQRRLTRLALAYLKRHRLLGYPTRFDVVAIVWPPHAQPQLRHIRDAFEAVGFDGMYS